jgi:predicted Ser/Thr protein kinase
VFPEGLEPREYEGICPKCLATLAMGEGDAPVEAEDAFARAAKDPPPLKRGGTFRGMEILEVVGQGGMGVVYKARQIDLDRVVALKILSPRLAGDPEFPRRFAREAQALASLDHPNIVRVYESGREADLCFLVLEYVDGVNLRELLVQKKLSPEQALRIVPQLCEALEYAHSKGVIHRDVKPENILLSRSGTAKIADFGLAKLVGDEKAAGPLTQTNVVMGTADYMAPEQRDSMREADHRADIYSLGVVFYELLTGELPVGRYDPPSRRHRLDARIDEIVLKALERDPDRRYQQAGQMGREVGEVAATGPAPSPDCPIVDLATGKRVGLSPARRLAVRTVACPVAVRGWDQEEVGIKVEGDYQFDADAATPLLQSQVETRSVGIFLPRGADLDLVATEGAARIEGVTGHASVQLPEGTLLVARHDGSLRIRSGEGPVLIEGLKTEYFEVRARAGPVSITGLELARGRGQVETESGPVKIRPAAASSFRFYLETRSGRLEGPASGQLGAGAGWLTVRSGSGDVTYQPPPAALALEGFRDFLRRLTPRQVEKIGVFFIVNTGLLIFFLAVARTAVPAICVAVFWGMSLAVELWKGYVRQAKVDGRALSEKVPGVLQSVMKFFPTPTPAPVPAAPPAPEPPRPRTSALAVLALLAGILAGLAAGGAAVSVLVELKVPLSGRDVSDLRMGAVVLGAAGFGLSVVGFVLGWAASNHIAEARGLLTGRGAAHVAMLFAVLAFAACAWYVRPHLRSPTAPAEERAPVEGRGP